MGRISKFDSKANAYPPPRSANAAASRSVSNSTARPGISYFTRPLLHEWYAQDPLPRDHPARLQLLPPKQIRTRGSVRTVDLEPLRELVLPPPGANRVRWDVVRQLRSIGISRDARLLTQNANGEIFMTLFNGKKVKARDGLYTFGIDQSWRLLTTHAYSQDGRAMSSAYGKSEGAPGSHTNLVGNLPALFFGELEIRDGKIAFNNRTNTYMTPARFEAQARRHPILKHAKFYAVPGSRESRKRDWRDAFGEGKF